MARPKTTWDDLPIALGLDRRRIEEMRAIPGAPVMPSVSAWRKWISANTDDDTDGADDRPSMPALKAAKLREEVRKLTIVNDARDKRLKEQWRQVGIDAATSILRRARGGLLGLLPDRVATASIGKDGTEIKLIVRREVEAVLDEAMRSDPVTA